MQSKLIIIKKGRKAYLQVHQILKQISMMGASLVPTKSEALLISVHNSSGENTTPPKVVVVTLGFKSKYIMRRDKSILPCNLV